MQNPLFLRLLAVSIFSIGVNAMVTRIFIAVQAIKQAFLPGGFKYSIDSSYLDLYKKLWSIWLSLWNYYCEPGELFGDVLYL